MRAVDAASTFYSSLYAPVFYGSRDAIFLANEEAQFVMVSPSASEMTGYTIEELLGMTIPQLHEAPDLHAFQQFFHSIMAGEEHVTTAPLLRKDGSKIPVEFSNRGIVIQGHRYMHTTAREVSERVWAEQHQDTVLRILKALTSSAGSLVGQTTKDRIDGLITVLGDSMRVDRAFCYMIPEATEKDQTPRKITEWTAPGVSPVQWPTPNFSFDGLGIDSVKDALISGMPVLLSADHAPPDLSRLMRGNGIAHTAIYPIFLNRRWWGFLGVDICSPVRGQLEDDELECMRLAGELIASSEERREEISRRISSEERYRSLFQLSNEPIVIMDASGRIAEMNQRAAEYAGLKNPRDEELQAMDFVPRRFRTSAWKAYRTVMTAGHATVELKLRSCDGHEAAVEISGSRIQAGQGQLVWILRNISQKDTLNQHLLGLSEDERMLLARTLHDGIAQDLKAIQLQMHLLVKHIESDKLRQDAEQVSGQITDSIRKIYSQVRQLAPSGFEPGSVEQRIRRLANDLAERQLCKLYLHLDASIELSTTRRATYLYRIVEQALQNIERHAEPTELTISLYQSGQNIHLFIQNNGAPLSARLKQTTTATNATSGFGIPIMRYYAESLGGSLSAKETTTGGFEVRCKFPREEP